MRMLRKRIGRLGVVMTFLALLFAASPSLEAFACAADGCGLFCLEQGAANGTGASDTDSGADTEDNCICAIGHCCHPAASVPATIETAFVQIAISAASPIETEPLVSTAPQTLERPPRA